MEPETKKRKIFRPPPRRYLNDTASVPSPTENKDPAVSPSSIKPLRFNVLIASEPARAFSESENLLTQKTYVCLRPPLTSNPETRLHLRRLEVNVDSRIQQAKNHAIAQAQQDGSQANFKIFDSPFGNFLVPVVPTRAQLGD